jgi:cytochrome P450
VRPLELDAFDLEFWQDVHGRLAAAREQHPLARLQPLGSWLVLRHADVEALLADPRLRSSYGGVAEGSLERVTSGLLANQEGETHARLRRLVGRAFTPRRVQRLRVAIRERARKLLAELPGGPGFDFQQQVAHPLTVETIGSLLGVPEEEAHALGAWTGEILVGALPWAEPARRERAQRAASALYAFLGPWIERRRARPHEALIDALIAAEEDGDRPSTRDLENVVVSLFLGGHESVRSFLTIAAWLALEQPGVLEALRHEPRLVANAVEEALRFETPLLGAPRTTTEALEIGGIELPAGSELLLELASANRDPRRFPAPDRFDLRRDASGHLAFGRGRHFCVGAALARAEAQELLARLAGEARRLVVAAPPRWVPFSPARRLEALLVRAA